MAQLDCEVVFAQLPADQDYWPLIQYFLEQEGVWPPEGQQNQNEQQEIHLETLGNIFEIINEDVIFIQLNPEWFVLCARVQQFVGQEVNAQNSVEAMLIRDLYLTPVVQGIRIMITNHWNAILNLAVRMAPTLAEHPLAPHHNDLRQQQAQRRVLSLMRVLVELSNHIIRAHDISLNCIQYMGIGQVIGAKLQPPHQG